MELEKQQKINLKEIAKRYHLKMVLLFGSQATGKTHKESDFDIAYLPEKNLSYDDEININLQFANIFRNDRVDTVDINKSNPLLLFQVSKNSILLYGNRQDFLKFKLYAFNAYNDYAPYFKMENNLNKKIINAYANR
ncbi:MAG: nucleotidyltransferase domain-containing protein [Candidatus Staskawiczbacteria bacterium]|nr:nucleotidyltransferase domain-containing protein [Candidatus Staskawiczbacteria bacterium]